MVDEEIIKDIVKQVKNFEKVNKVYFKNDKIWLVMTNETDIVYCDSVPEVSGLEYYIVTNERNVPAKANKG